MIGQLSEYSIELLKELVSRRGRIIRQKQFIPFETAMDSFELLGQLIMPGFVIDDDNRFAYENLVRWMINDPAALCNTPEGKTVPADLGKGIYLQGNTGTGKSMALDICRTLCGFFGLKIKTESNGQPISLQWRTLRADDICDLYAREGDMHPFKSEVALCIQDMGSEPNETLYMGNRRSVLGSIIEYRGDMYDRITLISSNISIGKVRDLYGQRVHSRLIQMCNIITLSGPDRRK